LVKKSVFLFFVFVFFGMSNTKLEKQRRAKQDLTQSMTRKTREMVRCMPLIELKLNG